MPKKKLLFVCHDASRTGAPLILLHFLRWLKKTDEFEFSVLLKSRGNGDLVADFESVATTYSVLHYGKKRKMLNEYLNRKSQADYQIPAELFKNKFDLIYINTVDGLNLAAELKQKLKCPVICHVHENEFTIKYLCPESLSPENKAAVDHYIAASKSTKDNLVQQHNIPAADISLVYEFIAVADIKLPTLSKQEIRNELGLTNQFIVGGSGLTSWRKGIDLFVQLAFYVNKLQPDNNIRFLWVGATYHEFECQWEYEGKRLNISDKIMFCGKKNVPQNYFQVFDVFALTSREDPFPLVVLEAAALNKPVLFFDNSGGIEEMFTSAGSGGIKVPYGDVEQMAAEVLRTAANDEWRLKLGHAAASVVTKYDVEVASYQIVDVMKKWL